MCIPVSSPCIVAASLPASPRVRDSGLCCTAAGGCIAASVPVFSRGSSCIAARREALGRCFLLARSAATQTQTPRLIS